jgi:hypothetical protein
MTDKEVEVPEHILSFAEVVTVKVWATVTVTAVLGLVQPLIVL